MHTTTDRKVDCAREFSFTCLLGVMTVVMLCCANRSHAGELPPGDDCFTAIDINVLPFSATGATCDYSDFSYAPCPAALPGSPDVVFRYTAVATEILELSLCNPCTDYDAQLYVFDGCPATGPIACSEDDCATPAFPDLVRAPTISSLPVTAGVTYYIVIDGSAGDCGVYDLTVTGPPTGACCRADGTCVEAVSNASCFGLGDRFHSGQTCSGLITCNRLDSGGACQPNGIWGPGFDEDTPFSGDLSDTAGGANVRAFEGFWGVTAPISRVSWWGTFLSYDGFQFNGPCMPNAVKTQFAILFHQDNGGMPGPVAAGPFQVTASVVDTGIPYGDGANVYLCTADLPMPVSLANGWISIAGLDQATMPNCVHLWVNQSDADPGDGHAWQASGGPTFASLSHDLTLCLAAPACNSCAGDLNGDGFANGGDIQTMIGCATAGPDVSAGCTCSDLNGDHEVGLDDAMLLAELLVESTFPGGACPPLFRVDVIDGALPDATSGADSSGAARGYAGVPVTLRILSDAPQLALIGESLVARSKTGAILLNTPLIFAGGESQIISLPPGDYEDVIHVFIEGLNVPPDTSIYRINVEAGPVATIQYFDSTSYLTAIGGPFDTSAASLNVVGFPGECGSAGPLNITSFPNDPDDPFSGEIGTMDLYTFRLLDSQGRPCSGQTVQLSPDDPTVIGLHPLADAERPVKFVVDGEADGQGFVHVLVDYGNTGQSGVTATPTTPPGPPMPVPGPGGQPAQFTGTNGGNGGPVVRVVAVTQGENGVKVNDGVKYTGGILNYGITYCIEARISRRLYNRDKIVWCINGMPLNDANGDRVEGRIAYIRIDDPNPNAANRAEVKLTSKIIRVNGQSQETVRSEETITLTVTEKVTLQLCVFQFATNNRHPSADDWAAELKRLNEVYAGTGVCFTVAGIMNINASEKGMNSVFGGDGKVRIGGKLVSCVCDDPLLHGSQTKITVFTGVNGRGWENGEWTNLNGNAMGANEVVTKSGSMADYDICGKWANTIAIKRDKVNAKRATLAHEIGHILGCEHHNHDRNNLMCGGKTRKEDAKDIDPTQAKTIQENAKKIKAGNC